jgi:probable HAF family extracellular repeat protein
MPPAYERTYATGINASGQVVGYAADTFGLPLSGAFLWTPGATNGLPGNPQMRDLGHFGGDCVYWCESAWAWGLNNAGHVVGHSSVEIFGWAIAHAFVWKNGRITDLGTLGDGPFLASVARDINDAGMVVGTSETVGTAADRNPHAFVYNTATRQMTDLGIHRSYGSSINRQNHVVGYYSPQEGRKHAMYWQPVTSSQYTATDLHARVSCGGNESEAVAINDNIQVVGWCEAHDGRVRAFFLDLRTGQVQHLDGSYYATRAAALNNHGLVVGLLQDTALDEQAFIWNPRTATMTPLDDRIPYNAEWTLFSAWGMNDAGQITGFGAHNGVARGFVLTPDPHPSLVSLTATPDTVAPGGSIEVCWAAPSDHYPTDWVGLFAVGAADGLHLVRQYTDPTGQETSGCLEFIAPTTEGTYEWRYFAQNTYRHVATSNAVHVRAVVRPGVVRLVSPSGSLTDTTPPYIWWALSAASRYEIVVRDRTGVRIRQQYSPQSAGCADGQYACAVTPNVTLAAGGGRWQVRAHNTAGAGPWSPLMPFTVRTP